MKTILTSLLLLAVLGPALEKIQAQESAAQQYRKLVKAYSAAAVGFRRAKTDEQRKAVVDRMNKFPAQFIDLADKQAKDPIALQVLRQAVQATISGDSVAHHAAEMNRSAFPRGTQGDPAGQLVKLLLRDHLQSAGLVPICDRMRWGLRKEFETFLSAAMERNRHRNVQGMACLALAQLLHNHLRMVDLARDRPELSKRYDYLYGNGYLRSIRGKGRAALAARVESLYERARKYDDVKNYNTDETVADKARRELFDLRHLSLGKQAPDIVGRDQDGKPFKLSGYRGKVVLIYFWLEF